MVNPHALIFEAMIKYGLPPFTDGVYVVDGDNGYEYTFYVDTSNKHAPRKVSWKRKERK